MFPFSVTVQGREEEEVIVTFIRFFSPCSPSYNCYQTLKVKAIACSLTTSFQTAAQAASLGGVAQSEESTISVCKITHSRDWLVLLTVIDEGLSMPPLPNREHRQFCSLGPQDTDGCGIVRIRTCDLQTMERTLFTQEPQSVLSLQ